jgi:septum formation inhibitor-activating ATPase MinD
VAERNNKSHTQRAREKIQTSQLINRLQENALAEKEFLTVGQIRSAEALIRKTVPDLKAVEHSGTDGKPLQIGLVQFASDSTESE